MTIPKSGQELGIRAGGEDTESAAYASIKSLALSIIEAGAPIAHHGGDEPYDGVMDAIMAVIREHTGFNPDQVQVSAANIQRREITRALRLQVFSDDDCACVTCGTTERLSLDHIVPIAKGGTNDRGNLQTLCVSCNSRKGDRL